MIIFGGFDMRLLVAAVMMTAALALADTSTQTDWAGGPGVQGPVTEWSTSFYLDTGCFYESPGQLSLPPGQVNAVSHGVAGGFEGAWATAPGDLDSDGDLDMAATAFFGDQVAWWENTGGAPPGWSLHLIDDYYEEGRTLEAADIDGDGDLDLVGASTFHDEVTLWSSSGGSSPTFTRSSICSGLLEDPVTAEPVDIDGDGDLDILMSAGDMNLLSWMENDGSSPPSWSFHSIYAGSGDESAWGATAFDMDGDGDTDAFVNIRAAGDYRIWCMLNDGGSPPSWDLFEVADDQAVYYDMDGADIDGDGDTDLVVSETSGNGLFWLSNTGTGPIWEFNNIGWIEDANSVCTGDFDLDGDIDAAGTSMNEYESGILWFESDGAPSGPEWEEHVVSELPSTSLSSGDFDGDGLPDLASAHPAADSLYWHCMIGYQPEGRIESSILDSGYEGVGWGEIDWTGAFPQETETAFSVRSGVTSGEMGSWSEWITDPGPLSPYLDDGDRYVQYKCRLQTDDPDSTPLLQEVAISYTQESLHGPGAAASGSEVTVVSPNPNRSGVLEAVAKCVGEVSVSVRVYDCAGRLRAGRDAMFSAGTHSMALPVGPPGLYIYRIVMQGDVTVGRMVVLE